MKRNIVIAAVTAAALVGGGTATALAVSGDGDSDGTARQAAADVRVSGDDARDDDARDDDATGTDDDSARAASAKVTAADAIASALRQSPGTAVSAELDDQDGDDQGPAAWEVDVLAADNTWHSVRIDPADGTVLGSHGEREDDTGRVRAALKGSSVTAAEAAKAAAGKGTVTSVELDEDGTAKAWDVETQSSTQAEQEWTVGLKSGKVTADRPDDHAADDTAADAGDDD
ncbi:PepSY domain-containing protein [Streptomyces sp. NPDC005263]|uniref:PepSY domain-containing protein n=1 Tax=Streptomyces sp. NPDC005263 TaxID=3364711 RepID=UPI0036B111EA